MEDNDDTVCLGRLLEELRILINDNYNVPPAQIPLYIDQRVRKIFDTLESFGFKVDIKYNIKVTNVDGNLIINLDSKIEVELQLKDKLMRKVISA